jgi:4-alpha-glucanotransferase
MRDDVAMSNVDPALAELAGCYGVATEYWDWRNTHVIVAAETLVAVLTSLGVDAADPALAIERFQRRPWTRTLPPCVISAAGAAARIDVHVTHGDMVEIWIELEAGGARHDISQAENWNAPRDIDGRPVGEATFLLPRDLVPGYHRLHVRSGGVESQTPLIVTPAWLGLPHRLDGRKAWGLATQLYSVRSRQSWGVGDLSDLAGLASWAGSEHDAGFVLVNPLHAAEPLPPLEPSPYLPTSRRFANPLYLRIEQIPEYSYLGSKDRKQIKDLRTQLARDLLGLDRIDRNLAWTAKRAALELVFQHRRGAIRDVSFRAYCRREDPGLTDFATWSAIAEVHGNNWHLWPVALRHPSSTAVQTFRAERADAVGFHRWLQWVTDEQLDGVQATARRAGMTLGVMHDLAVGVNPDGADAWALQDSLAGGVTVGAPPDAFNQTGQNWHQPPWRPDQMAELAYEPFRQLVSTVLRHAGGLRVDHIIGLFRLWWIPLGAAPTAGTYVRYDHDALVGILALEAARADAVVVGEDLGVVEPWVRDYLRERGVLGTSILWFEFDYDAPDSPPLPAQKWREYCLASVTTHDLPPTAGYLAGDHVALRESLGLLTRTLDEELAAARAEQAAWLEELRDRGVLAAAADADATVLALHRYLSQTPARLTTLALTDAVGDRQTQNQPGTRDEYPNWRIPLTGPDGAPMLLEDVIVSPRAAALAEVMRQP